MDDLQWRGFTIFRSRSCGDCPNGPPCRCHPKFLIEILTEEEWEAVAVYLRAHWPEWGSEWWYERST
jgi:hypothetical protein